MTNTKTIRAGLIIIGNEILSGRTLDKNTQHIALTLSAKGIQLAEVRIIPDILDTVSNTVNAMRTEYDYIFTTGGLGPTHDDITVECIAAAFNVPVIVNDEAYRRLEIHYGKDDFTTARQRMARTPHGAALIDNPVSTAPGFIMDNVYSMAGVPKIMQAMLDNILSDLESGTLMHSRTVSCNLPESELSATLSDLQNNNPSIDIGSYPFFHSGSTGVSVVLRGADTAVLDHLSEELYQKMESLNGNPKKID